MRVLVVKTSSLGDVIHTLPALTDAARAIPGVRFDWLVEENFAEVPTWHPAVERVIPVALRRWRRSVLRTWLAGEWQAMTSQVRLADYDLAIDAQGLIKSAILTRYAGAPVHGLDRASIREPLASRFYDQRHAVAKGRHAVERVRELFAKSLGYALPEFGVRMPFRPTDFTQVNARINEVLVRRALRWLDPQPGARVVDLFCGLGNFTLPIAARGAHVVGIEGNRTLVDRAAANAALNGLGERCEFRAANLFEIDAEGWRALGRFDAALIDPPREGAIEVVKAIAGDEAKPGRIVYVSCNPATLARDAGVLVHSGGYVLRAAGAVNMFPQTSHVESLAVFDVV